VRQERSSLVFMFNNAGALSAGGQATRGPAAQLLQWDICLPRDVGRGPAPCPAYEPVNGT
jgi:hypothetical protein